MLLLTTTQLVVFDPYYLLNTNMISSDLVAYLGFNVNFRSIYISIPMSSVLYKHWTHNLSFSTGLTLTSHAIPNKRNNLFGSSNLLTGIGFRINNRLRITSGVVWFKTVDKNPVSINHPGGKKVIVAMLKGTQAKQIITVLERIPVRKRNKVKEVTMDMAANMIKAIRRCFTNTIRVIDRFHVQILAYDAVQEARIKYRREALDAESSLIEEARKNKQVFKPEVFSNGDTLKQLLARSRYLLFKLECKWTASQKERAELLFPRYPELFKAYNLAIRMGNLFTICKSKQVAFKRLAI
ncbi:hypothetical protein A0256_22470 [Mucilaginibacter sp. PAMC 26640]|nr:hypothetical protein A0256_22470 [Mucilaginibacter sp. PAMC 26640]